MKELSECLRASSKGKLKYDRFWVEEGRTEKILQINNELTKLYHINPRNIFREDPVRFTKPLQSEPDDSIQDTSKKLVKTRFEHDEDEHALPVPASPVQMCLVAYEEERNKKVLENVDMRHDLIEQYTQFNDQWAEQQMEHMRQKIHLDMQRKVNQILLERDKELQDVRERQEKQHENTKSKARRLNDRKKEADARQRQIEELQQQKKREQLDFRTKLMDIQKECNYTVNQIMEQLQANRENKWLSVQPTNRGLRLKEIRNDMDALLLKYKEYELNVEMIQEAQNILCNVKKLLQDLGDDIAQAITRKEHHEQELKIKEKSQDVTNKNERPAITVRETKEKEEKDDASLLYQSISPSSLQEYARVIEHQKTWEKTFQSLLDDASLKKYRFDLQKAVNTPINAISRVSGMHLRDKVERLTLLLSGQLVTVGNKRITCNSHPHGLHFCMDLLAKKIITQAENQVPSNHEAAFPLAAVMVSLLIRFPDLKPLLLAHLYIKCPYLVPYYIPQKEGQSQEEHYKSLGYLYIDGAVEQQDKFLKRMSGIVRFYAAILHTAPMPGIGNTHPHGLSFGWKFLARILNLRPRAEITPSVLYDFLDVAGNALYCAYGKQFRKLLHVLCKDYFQEIEKATPGGSGGPLSRLQDFLQNTIRSGKIAPPAGVLTPGFWNSR